MICSDHSYGSNDPSDAHCFSEAMHMKHTCLLGLFILLAPGCGGQSLSDADPGGTAGVAGAAGNGAATGSGGFGAGGSSGSGGGAGIGSAGAVGSGGVPSTCVQDEDWTFQQPTCDDLAPLALTDFLATDSGDGMFKAGEPIQISVNLNETSGTAFSYYPGVTFRANHPSVFFGKQSEEHYWLYAIEGCGTTPLSTTARILGDIAPGTKVELTAQVGMLNQECANGNVAKLTFVVQ
jgi:hypothetical protein